jgi:SET domain-containing protein
MLKVKTSLKSSSIAGLGLFAEEFIPKGTLIFQEDNLSIKIPQADLENYSSEEVDYVHTYGYLRDGVWYCSMDNDKFTNHSEKPNVEEMGDCTYASRDIQIGEEILTNYDLIGCIKKWDKN